MSNRAAKRKLEQARENLGRQPNPLKRDRDAIRQPDADDSTCRKVDRLIESWAASSRSVPSRSPGLSFPDEMRSSSRWRASSKSPRSEAPRDATPGAPRDGNSSAPRDGNSGLTP